MIYAHILSPIVLSSPSDITDDPRREILGFNEFLSSKASQVKKIFSIPYILKAHMFHIILGSGQTSLNTHKLSAKSICYGKCVSAIEKSICP